MRRPPKASLLNAFRAERVNHALVIGEAIDNSFDAGARNIAIIYDAQRIAFKDDGVGLDERRLDALYTLGGHAEMATTALGMYGIGIKIQAVNAGDRLKIESTALIDGIARSFIVEIDWRKLEKTDWDYPDPYWTPTLIGAATGTKIEITHLRPARRQSNSQIIDDIAKRFQPAIASGARILFNDIWVPLLDEPNLSSRVECHLTFGERRAHVVAGILHEPSKLWGTNVGFQHRMVLMNDTLGTDGYGGITKMFARVTLSGPDDKTRNWHLNKFKDGLANQTEFDELEAALGEILAPILQQCETQAFDARIDGIEEWINANLPPDKIAARPKRKKPRVASLELPEPPPGVKKPPREIPPDNADIGKGPTQSRATQKDKLRVEFVDALEDHAIALFKAGRPDRVLLARDNPTIATLLHYRDEKFARAILRDFALVFYAEATYKPDMFQPFGSFVAQLLAMNIVIEPRERASEGEP